MVEFALVLPVLLLIILGIIELGHLLFYYGSLYAATREAARYGAAVDVPGATPKYMDVTGMRDAAKRVGFIVGLADDQIDISYDCGNGTASSLTVPTCGANQMLRVAVQVDATYTPVVPIPNVPAIPVSSTVARTVVHELEVEGNFPPAPDPPDPPDPDCDELLDADDDGDDLVLTDAEVDGGGNVPDFPNWHKVVVKQVWSDPDPSFEPPAVTLTYLEMVADWNSQHDKIPIVAVLVDPIFLEPTNNPDLVIEVQNGLIWSGNKIHDPIYLDGRAVGAAPRTLYLKFDVLDPENPDYKAAVTVDTACGPLPPLTFEHIPTAPYPYPYP